MKKETTLKNIIILAYMTAVLFPVISGADSYFKLIIRVSFLPIFLLLLVFIPVLVNLTLIKSGHQMSKIYSNTKGLTIPLLLVAIVSAIWGLFPGAYWDEGVRKILMDAYYFVIVVLSIGIASSVTVQKYHRLIFLAIFLASCASIWVDMIAPGTFSEHTHRTAGFYKNANSGAMSVIFLAIATINWKKHDLLSLFVLMVVGLAVFTTLSVQALIFLTLLFGAYVIFTLGGKGMIMRKIFFAALIPVLGFVLVKPLLIGILENSTITENMTSLKRLEQIISMSQGDMTFAEDHDRLELIRDYWNTIQESPILGQGTGYIDSQFKGPHNMYLKQWVENGLLGLLLYLAMIGFAFRHFWLFRDVRGMILCFAFFYSGFFGQNLLQNPTLLTLLAMLGVLAYKDHVQEMPAAEPMVKAAV